MIAGVSKTSERLQKSMLDKTQIIDFFQETAQEDLSVYESSFLDKTLAKRLGVTGTKNMGEYLSFLRRDSLERKVFLHSLHIKFSQFFRDSLSFALLENLILPEIFSRAERENSSQIRIWSAGCAQGPEAYSLAILADSLTTHRFGSKRLMIFGTDISESALDKARQGEYNMEVLGELRMAYFHKYFTGKGPVYSLVSKIKKGVDFSCYDLLDGDSTAPPESIYGNFDLIVCANVLMYYNQKARNFILKKLFHSLREGGYLMVGESEKSMVEPFFEFYLFTPMAPIFRKTI